MVLILADSNYSKLARLLFDIGGAPPLPAGPPTTFILSINLENAWDFSLPISTLDFMGDKLWLNKLDVIDGKNSLEVFMTLFS